MFLSIRAGDALPGRQTSGSRRMEQLDLIDQGEHVWISDRRHSDRWGLSTRKPVPYAL